VPSSLLCSTNCAAALAQLAGRQVLVIRGDEASRFEIGINKIRVWNMGCSCSCSMSICVLLGSFDHSSFCGAFLSLPCPVHDCHWSCRGWRGSQRGALVDASSMHHYPHVAPKWHHHKSLVVSSSESFSDLICMERLLGIGGAGYVIPRPEGGRLVAEQVEIVTGSARSKLNAPINDLYHHCVRVGSPNVWSTAHGASCRV